jgi:hypothetical protein
MFHTSIRYNGNMHTGLPFVPTRIQKQLLDKRVSPGMLQMFSNEGLERLLSHRG